MSDALGTEASLAALPSKPKDKVPLRRPLALTATSAVRNLALKTLCPPSAVFHTYQIYPLWYVQPRPAISSDARNKAHKLKHQRHWNRPLFPSHGRDFCLLLTAYC